MLSCAGLSMHIYWEKADEQRDSCSRGFKNCQNISGRESQCRKIFNINGQHYKY